MLVNYRGISCGFLATFVLMIKAMHFESRWKIAIFPALIINALFLICLVKIVCVNIILKGIIPMKKY